MWRGALAELRQTRDEIDRLNVFPVPDGDTGHNLCATVESMVGRLASHADGTFREAVRAAGDGALYGARGNSGVILSQWIRGLCEVLLTEGRLSAEAFAQGLARGADEARRHVADPKPGTILTVADSAARATADESLIGVLDQATRHAEAALKLTTGQLDALRRAGVVDAGGRGLVAVLHGLRQGLTGKTRIAGSRETIEVRRSTGVHEWDVQHPYDVEALMAPKEALPAAIWEDRLAELGTSVVVATGLGSELKLHIHTDRPAELLARLLSWGAVWQMETLDMRHQVDDHTAYVDDRTEVACPEAWRTLFYSLGMSPAAVRGHDDADHFTVTAGEQSVRVTSPGQAVAALQAHWDGRLLNPLPAVREWVWDGRTTDAEEPWATEMARIEALVSPAADLVVTVFLDERASAVEAEWWAEKLNAVVVEVPGLPVRALILAA